MSPQDIVPAAGLNEIGGSGVLIAASLIRAAKNVKIYRSQCGDLSRRCLDLVSALQDHSPGLEGTRAQQAVDEVERVLTHIHKRVAKWAELGKMKSFVKQTEIKAELDNSYRELEACSVRFNISLHLYASTRSKELEEIRRRDHDELIEMITRFLHDNNLLKELREADFGETQERELQENFSELSRWVEGLPPMVDLSGNVTRSDHPIATGGSQDIYTGEWTGQEVALAYPRNQTRAAQERFRRQVEIWRTLRHPNVLPLLGIAYIGNFVYSVSPYMEFGNIMQYLKIHPEAHRVLLLSEIASGASAAFLYMLACLWFTSYRISPFTRNHPRGFTRGGDGHACLADFGCARVEEVEVTGPTEALTYGSTRWLAPELMTQSNYVPTTRNTDVWSFGMLCVEIFTDNVPFNLIPNEAFIPLVIRDGTLPTRPEGNDKGLTDAMWDLMNRCWRREPESRPKMPEIRETIQNMLPTRSGSLSDRQIFVFD
ncbi:kinase-like domain-containing protein [Lactarius sanguifluus]|nr:kinase-like domain-containing protein [Lactarius sanguifluus]